MVTLNYLIVVKGFIVTVFLLVSQEIHCGLLIKLYFHTAYNYRRYEEKANQS